MNKEGMIREIYEKVANKELSFGCKIQFPNGVTYNITDGDVFTKQEFISRAYDRAKKNTLNSKFIIIGHSVMIGDVLDWLEKNIKYKDYETFEQLGGKVSVDVKHGNVSFIVGTTVFSSLRMQNKVGNEATVFFHKQNIDNKWKDKTQPIEHPENIEALTYIYNLIKNEGT